MEIDTIALGLRSWNYTSYTSPCILISSNYYTSASTVAEDVGHLKNGIQKVVALEVDHHCMTARVRTPILDALARIRARDRDDAAFKDVEEAVCVILTDEITALMASEDESARLELVCDVTRKFKRRSREAWAGKSTDWRAILAAATMICTLQLTESCWQALRQAHPRARGTVSLLLYARPH